jgi:hypothetical protein
VIELSESSRDGIERRYGESGVRFLADLGRRIVTIAERWALTVEAPYPVGIGGVVLRVLTADGDRAALKLSPTGTGEWDAANAMEWWMLRRLDGRGAVRAMAFDAPLGALLLERCDPGDTIATLSDDAMLRSGCAAIRAVHRVEAADDANTPDALESLADLNRSTRSRCAPTPPADGATAARLVPFATGV